MEKVRVQILLTVDNYQWLVDVMTTRRLKNLSAALNGVINSYIYIVKTADRTQEEQNRQEQLKQKLETSLDNYKAQLKGATILHEKV